MAYTYSDDCDDISKDISNEIPGAYNSVYNTRGVSQSWYIDYDKCDTNINIKSICAKLGADGADVLSAWIYNNKVPITDYIYNFTESGDVKYIYDAIVLSVEYLHEIPSKLIKYIPDMDTHHVSAAIASWLSGCGEELHQSLCEQLHRLSNAEIFDICNDVHDNELIQYSDIFVNEIKSRTDVKFINAMISLYLDCTKCIVRKPKWLNDKYYKDAVLIYDHDTLNKQWRFIIRLYNMNDYNMYVFPKWLLELIPKNRLDRVYADLLMNDFDHEINHGIKHGDDDRDYKPLDNELEDDFIKTFNEINDTFNYTNAEYVMYVNMHKRLYKFEDIFYKYNGAVSMLDRYKYTDKYNYKVDIYQDESKFDGKYMQHVGLMCAIDDADDRDTRREYHDVSDYNGYSFYRYNDMNIVIPQEFVCEEVYNKHVDDKHNLVNLCTYIRVNNGIDSINDVPEHIVKRLTQEHIDIINNALSTNSVNSVSNGIHTFEDINNIIDKLSLALPECHKGVEDYISVDEKYIEEHKDEFIDKDANKYIHRNDIFGEYGKVQCPYGWRFRDEDGTTRRLTHVHESFSVYVYHDKCVCNSLLHDYTIRNRDAKYDRDVVDKNTNNGIFKQFVYKRKGNQKIIYS